MNTHHKRILVLFLVLLLPLFLMVKCYQELHYLTRESALQEAKVRLKIQCEMHCKEYGFIEDDFQGPFEAGVNKEVDTKHYEFTWRLPDNTELLVAVYDNGLFVTSDWMWINTPEERRIRAEEEQKNAAKPQAQTW
ncbi:hypothetical protein ED236_01040 [Pseudomethylobacillus aquaticus]|uniref:Uncharacterized protein n=1 Tax=Pseudomethylobacillus aquaticus TaxID=2676064 RepID=A0A3N0V6U8_9PROT|nr:hypothetical protein [Pseudomethylobacillus aquaticus]ROH88098.1 hypothetical protein ED236_01040 [Pseudomethylobacillus aquaticus]